LIRNRAIWLLIASFAILFTCFAQQQPDSSAGAAPPAAPAASSAPQAAPQATPQAGPPPGMATASDQTASFSGYVRTSAGIGIPGASVRITNTDTGKSWATWTDAQGRFSLPALPLGHYHIEATQLGFVQSASDFSLSAYANEKPALLTLNVATLAQLNSQNQSNVAANQPGIAASNPAAANGNAANGTTGPTNGAPGQGRGRGGYGRGSNGGTGGGYGRGVYGRGTQGQGAAAAGNQNGQGGQNQAGNNSFAQTDLTGATNTDDQTQQISSGDQFGADSSLASAGATGNTNDAMLLQGGMAQGANFGGPGGPGGPGGLGGFGPGGPGGIAGGDIGFGAPGDSGAFTGAGGGAVGAGFGGGPGGGAGGAGGPGGGGFGGGRGGGGGGFGGGRGGGGGGGAFGGGRGGRGGNAGAGRLFRQRANRYRYAFYDTYNNSVLNAKPFVFTGPQVAKLPTYNENFGGDLQGPLKIPHLYDGTGRTNVFLNYEHRTNEAGVNDYSIVPTAAELTGNFCGVLGSSLYLFNPYAPGTQLGNGCNLATSGLTLDPAAQKILGYIPAPNIPTDPTTGYNYLLQAHTPQNTDIFNLRLMHTLNAKFNLTGVYAANLARSNSVGNYPGLTGHTSTLGQSITLTLNHNWSARTVERTNASWSRSRSLLTSDESNGTNVEAALGIVGQSTNPFNYGLPQISGALSLNDPIPSLTRNQTLLLGDAISVYKTKHTVVLGAQIRDINLNNNASPNPRGAFSFNGDFTCDSAFSSTANNLPTCNDPLGPNDTTTPNTLTTTQQQAFNLADFLIGLPFNVSAQYGTPQNIYLRSWGFAAYAQDDWRVTKTFTLQYGLRWDATKPTVEKYNHLANVQLTLGATPSAVIVTPGQNGYPRALIDGAYKNFGPRTGFAWILPEKKKRTVVRGGYSIFYNVNVFTSLVRQLSFQAPYDVAFSTSNPVSSLFTTETALQAANNPALTGVTIPNTTAVDPDYKPYRAQTWNIGTETDLSRNWVLDLQYTGTAGANLDILRSPNRAAPGSAETALQANRLIPYATNFTYDQSGATSLYNGLQVRVVHRYTHGISFQGQYTYSKSLDDSSSVGGSGGGGLIEEIDGDIHSLRGLSAFDQRHNFRGTATYELPFGQRYRFANHGLTNKLFGDWRLLNTVTWHTGSPLAVIAGGSDADPSGTGSSGFTRLDQNGNPSYGLCGGSVTAFFNTGVFKLPQNYDPSAGFTGFGNSRKDAVEGPCSIVWNASMNKAFRIGNTDNQRRGEIEWNVTNVANHVNYSGIGTTLGSTGGTFGHVTSAGAMRAMSLTLRFNF
jgi:carboxypeptidase family protein